MLTVSDEGVNEFARMMQIAQMYIIAFWWLTATSTIGADKSAFQIDLATKKMSPAARRQCNETSSRHVGVGRPFGC